LPDFTSAAWNSGYTPPPPPPKQTPIGPTSSFGNPGTFTAAANTQAGDYDTIMKGYADFISNAKNNPITSTNVTPQLAPYAQSSDVTGSLSNLSNLAATGGYSDADKADIRARDISPIRSIYANAQQNVERSKALKGGYSPNFEAVQSKMARDEADKIGDVTTNANAGIAQNVASNRLAAASPYAGASAGANAAKTQADQANANIVNQINTGNADRSFQAQLYGRNNTLGALSGATSLYGTTPALTNTFGNQVIQAGQLGQGQQQINDQKQRDIFNFAGAA